VNRLLDVLHLAAPHVIEHEVELADELFEHAGGNGDAAGLGRPFQSRGYVHARRWADTVTPGK
jgi:hypothetical protein